MDDKRSKSGSRETREERKRPMVQAKCDGGFSSHGSRGNVSLFALLCYWLWAGL